MYSNVTDLMQRHCLIEHGVVDMAKVIQDLEDHGERPARILLKIVDDPSQRRWQLAALEGLRALAAQGECTKKEALLLLKVSQSLAHELGSDQLTKTINAVVGSRKSATALIDLINEFLEQGTSSADNRWLIFYTIAMINANRTVQLPSDLQKLLFRVAQKETAGNRRKEYYRIIRELQTAGSTQAKQVDRILLIEAERPMLEKIKTWLEEAAYDVVTASTGAQALKRASQHPLSLILLDLQMPEMDGYEILDTLRKRPQTSPIPILPMVPTSEKTKLKKAGLEEYLVKPITSEKLIGTVNDIFHRDKAESTSET